MNAPPHSDAPPPSSVFCPRIGIFDSGVGGLSVLPAIQAALPTVPLTYFADSAHAPYGERKDDYVLERSRHIAGHLIGQGCDALVIACNTATAVAATALRQAWPAVPIVGMEPGVKPAVLASKNRRVGVMATRVTLESPRFQRLLHDHGQGATIVLQACPGLALAIESGDLRSAAILDLVERHCDPLRQAGVDTVVLGCTHYVFVRDLIEAAMGTGVSVIDTAQAVARQTARLLGFDPLRPPPPAGASSVETRLESSGDVEQLQRIATKLVGRSLPAA